MTDGAVDADEPDREEAAKFLEAILQCQDEISYLALLEETSERASDDLQALIAEMPAEADFRVVLGYVGKLLFDSQTDPERAWRNYRLEFEGLENRAALLSPQLDEIELALAEGRCQEALTLSDSARLEFAAAGLTPQIGRMHVLRALAYVQMRAGDLRNNDDMAIREIRAAARTLTESPGQQARDLMRLGLAFAWRVSGDRAENLEYAVNALGEALSLADRAGDAALLAEVRTNQASALLRRERGDVSENRRIAVALCRDALEYRTPSRNPIDWLHSQIILADALDSLARLGKVNPNDVVEAYAAILDVEELEEQAAWAFDAAHYGIGRLFLHAASETIDDRAPGDESRQDPTAEVTEWLVAAREHLEESVDGEVRLASDTVRGRALSQLAQTHFRLGDATAALRYGREALELLTPVTDPYECSTIAWAVADWLSDQELWEEASDAFRIAVDASELTLHARLSTDRREYEMHRVGGMYRWASYTLARAGHCEEAAFVLDIGRSRELRRRLGTDEYSDPLIDRVPEELRSAYQTALSELAESPLGDDANHAGEHLQRVLTEIRHIPGLADFAAKGRPEDLFGSVEDGWPVIFINPTPRGLCFLRIAPSPDGPSVDSLVLDAPRSLEVLMRVVAGVSSSNPADWHEGELVSYVREASGFAEGRGERLVGALDSLLPWIGEAIMRPLWEFVKGPDIRGLTLIPCGPLTLTPLAACPWTEDDRSSCLLDHVPVRYPPSAPHRRRLSRQSGGR